MEIMNDKGRWTRSVSTVLARSFAAGRQMRKIYAAERTPTGAANRADARAFRRAAISEQAARRLQRRVLRQLGLDRDIEIWGKNFRVRATRKTSGPRKKATSNGSRHGSKRPLVTYLKPIRDSRGRVALFMRVRYKGFRSKGWTAGMTAEHIFYIYRDGAIEQAAQANGIISNMGLDPAEIAEGWQALEEVEEAYRANAIVQHRMVVGLPYQLSPEGRGRVLKRFCERAFDRHGLPYAAVPHLPDPDGDARNFHGHIALSTRPMERVGSHEWEISQEKVNGLTDAQGLLRLRALFAAIVNKEFRREGIDLRVTHQTYQARGIDAQRQDHMGPQLVGLHREGETVDMARRNEAIVDRNEEKQQAKIDKGLAALVDQLIALTRRQLDNLSLRQLIAQKRERIERVATGARAVSKAAKEADRLQQGLARVNAQIEPDKAEPLKGPIEKLPPVSPARGDGAIGLTQTSPPDSAVKLIEELQPVDQAINALADIIMLGDRGLDLIERLDEPWQHFLKRQLDDQQIQRAWFLRPKRMEHSGLSLADALDARYNASAKSTIDRSKTVSPSTHWPHENGRNLGS